MLGYERRRTNRKGRTLRCAAFDVYRRSVSLILRWRRRNGCARSVRLPLLLLLLKLQLALLHLLQHLLRRFHDGLIRRRWGLLLLLFRLGGRLIRGVIRIVVRGIRVRLWQPCSWISRVRHDSGLRLFRDRRIVWACIVLRTLCYEHDSRQHRIVRRRAQQYIVESRSVQEFSDDFARWTRPEMSDHTLCRGRNLNFCPSLFANGSQNVAQG